MGRGKKKKKEESIRPARNNSSEIVLEKLAVNKDLMVFYLSRIWTLLSIMCCLAFPSLMLGLC